MSEFDQSILSDRGQVAYRAAERLLRNCSDLFTRLVPAGPDAVCLMIRGGGGELGDVTVYTQPDGRREAYKTNVHLEAGKTPRRYVDPNVVRRIVVAAQHASDLGIPCERKAWDY